MEQHVAIFLYTCVTGLSIHHVGERFQHANATISKYVSLPIANENTHPISSQRSFCTVLYALSSPPFYATYVRLPTMNDLIPFEIASNPKFFPSLRVLWVPWMGLISTAVHHWMNSILHRTRQGGFHKIHWLVASAWKSSPKTAQDWKFPGLSKTATTVWSSVSHDFRNLKTNKRPV